MIVKLEQMLRSCCILSANAVLSATPDDSRLAPQHETHEKVTCRICNQCNALVRQTTQDTTRGRQIYLEVCRDVDQLRFWLLVYNGQNMSALMLLHSL